MRRYIFARKIAYSRNEEAFGLTPCPHGGSVEERRLSKREPLRYPGAKVGSHACSWCIFNRGTEWSFVMCNRKPEK